MGDFFYLMNNYMFIQQCAKFHDKKRILGVDFEENVEFVLISVCPWAAKSVCL